jgi:energy-converting hydrogenase Eha subunit E
MEGNLTLLFALLAAGTATALILLRALARLLFHRDDDVHRRDLAE